MAASFQEAMGEHLRTVVLTISSTILSSNFLAQSLMLFLALLKDQLALYPKVKMRAPGKSIGRRSLSQNAFVVGCVHVSVASPLSP